MNSVRRSLPRPLVELFRRWQPGDAQGVEPELQAVFGTGHSNRSFLVRWGEQRLVVRVPGNGSDVFGVDRKVEQRVLAAVERAGIGAAVLHCEARSGVLVTRYMESRPLRVEGLGADDTIDQLAQVLGRLHAISLDVPAINVDDRIRRYARQIRSLRPRQWPRARRWLAACQQQIEQYRFGRWKARLCHHDLVLQNILQLEDGVRFIDWEYAARGDPFFDLATIAEECAFGAVDRQRLLLAYGEVGEAAEDRLYRTRVLQRLLAVLWYLLRGRMSSNDLLPTLRRQEQSLEQLLQNGPGS